MQKIKRLMILPTFSSNHYTFFGVAVVLICYLWDIGNPNAIRQGTESFYLQISKEMYQSNNFLSPIVYGANHWSKPPLHFWLSFPLYFIFQTTALWAARASMVLVSLGGIYYISGWVERQFKVSRLTTILFFATALGINKYSRIYMMELPLTIFSAIAVLTFFESLEQKNLGLEFFSAFFLALAGLEKGPVALVMCSFSLFLYSLLQLLIRRENFFRQFFRWTILATFLSSLWYFYMYSKFGMDFINYFFVRENFGKFSTKTYPISSVFGGLLVYSLPWCPLLLRKIDISFFSLAKPTQLLLISFSVFFTLWLFPTQRSHHYAMPSLPFFLILILISFQSMELKVILKKFKLLSWSLFFLIIPLLFISTYVVTFPEIDLSVVVLLKFVFGVMAIGGALFLAIQNRSIERNIVSFFIIVSAFWLTVIPLFYRPVVPERVTQLLFPYQLYSTISRPYFLAEVINSSVTPISPRAVDATLLSKNNCVVILPLKKLMAIKNNRNYKIIAQWPTWRRRIRLNDFVLFLKNKNFSSLTYQLVAITR